MTPSIVPMSTDPAAVAVAGPQVRAGYGMSLTDVAAFEQAMSRVQQSGGGLTVQPSAATQAPGHAMQALFRPLEHINTEATNLSSQAQAAVEAGRSLTPAEMVQLTVKCHEFMFHCQLTSNVANRTSDGLQQLFRQQA